MCTLGILGGHDIYRGRKCHLRLVGCVDSTWALTRLCGLELRLHEWYVRSYRDDRSSLPHMLPVRTCQTGRLA